MLAIFVCIVMYVCVYVRMLFMRVCMLCMYVNYVTCWYVCLYVCVVYTYVFMRVRYVCMYVCYVGMISRC